VSDRRLRLAALVLTAVGIGISAYLTYVHYEGLKPVCGLGGDCEKVQTSAYAALLGVPVAVLGLIGYLVLLATLFVEGENALMTAAVVALVGFGFSMYLTYRELFTIDAICPWCVGSAVVLTLLSVITVTRFLRASPAG
jgi:uncharacterized membrane protein